MPFNIDALKTGKVPASALRLSLGPESFSAANDADGNIKVHLKARAKEPIEHPWWGRLIHDMATLKAPERIALDDSHGDEIGYASWRVSEWGLELDGFVCRNKDNPNSSAERIAWNLSKGIPQQASISFVGNYDVEILSEKQSATVNGIQVEGPSAIIRNWSLRACAICKMGADPNTSTQAELSASENASNSPNNIIEKEAPMTPEELAQLNKTKADAEALGAENRTLKDQLAAATAKPAAAVESFKALASKHGLEFASANYGKPEAEILQAALDATNKELQATKEALAAKDSGNPPANFGAPPQNGGKPAEQFDAEQFKIARNCGLSVDEAREFATIKKEGN